MLQLPLQWEEAYFPSVWKKNKLQNWFNPFVIQTWRVRVTSALTPEICCSVFCTKWVLFIVPCHSLRAWKLAFLFEAVFRKDCKYISGSFDFWKSSCSIPKRWGGGRSQKSSAALISSGSPRLSPLVPVLGGAGRCKINTCYNGLCDGSTSLSTWLQKLERSRCQFIIYRGNIA